MVWLLICEAGDYELRFWLCFCSSCLHQVIQERLNDRVAIGTYIHATENVSMTMIVGHGSGCFFFSSLLGSLVASWPEMKLSTAAILGVQLDVVWGKGAFLLLNFPIGELPH